MTAGHPCCQHVQPAPGERDPCQHGAAEDPLSGTDGAAADDPLSAELAAELAERLDHADLGDYADRREAVPPWPRERA